jgi:hypothetical protein
MKENSYKMPVRDKRLMPIREELDDILKVDLEEIVLKVKRNAYLQTENWEECE